MTEREGAAARDGALLHADIGWLWIPASAGMTTGGAGFLGSLPRLRSEAGILMSRDSPWTMKAAGIF